MTLRYIALHMNADSGFETSLRDEFNLRTRFISNFLSRRIRPLKFATDGSFDMISIVPSIHAEKRCRVVGDKALRVEVPFDEELYRGAGDQAVTEYALKLLETGFHESARFKRIPSDNLETLIEEFRRNGLKNEWIHRKRLIREAGIEVTLCCSFGAHDFRLSISVYDRKKKKSLGSALVARTLPDEVCFAHLFKDIKLQEGWLVVTEFQGKPKFRFRLSDVLQGELKPVVTDEGVEYVPYDGE